MKKLIISLSMMIMMLSTTNTANAQGFLNKMKDKLNNALSSPNTWWQYYEDMDDKTRSKVTLENIKFKVLDENTLQDDNNTDGDGTRSSRIVNYKKTKVGNSTESIFMDGTSHHNGIIRLPDSSYMKICFLGENELKNLVLIKVYSHSEKMITKLNKEYDKCDEYKTLEKYLKLYMAAWDETYAAQKAEQKKKNDANDDAFELPAPSSFAPLSQKQLMAAANAKFNEDGKHKITYCYYATPKFTQRKNQTEWANQMEKKLVNGTYDNVVTKRTLSVIIVMQYAGEQAPDRYFVRMTTLTEDAAMGVYDGSKFTGKYYFNGSGAMSTNAPAANALKYKSVVK